MERNRSSDQSFKVEFGKVVPGGELPHGFDVIAQHAPEGAATRAFSDGTIPQKGHGRYSLPNAAERALFFQQVGDIFEDPVVAKNKRRQNNANAHRPYGRLR